MSTVTASISRFLSPALETPFKRTWPGWTLVALNLIMTAMSLNFFLGMLKSGFEGWLMMNTCAPSIFLFVLGFLLGSPAVMVAGAIAMFRYGTLGMFVFSWSGSNIVAQVGHIFMTLTVIYTILEVIRNRRWKSSLQGLVLAVVLLVPFTFVQENWVKAHPALVEQLFKGTLTLPE
ncbi:MAG: hypothetical protein AB9891_08055 [Anaerolineaceae bacterium]